MSTAAVICEFNPFHQGHRRLFDVLKSSHGIDHIICIMSGSFVQRGEPAVLDKYERARMAVLGGADLVIELPPPFAVSASREFAACGVRLAEALGVCEYLAFGVEKDNSDISFLSSAPHMYGTENKKIKEGLKRGLSYPEAVSEASGIGILPPNAILASAYIEELNKNRVLKPLPVIREGSRYECTTLSGELPSALAVRKLLLSGNEKKALPALPVPPLSSVYTSPDMLSPLMADRLLSEDDFTRYLDVSEEISGRLLNRRNLLMTFSERVDDTKTRQYTRSRIQRALLHIILRITKEEAAALKNEGYAKYIRILGYRSGSGLLSEIKKKAKLPIYSKSSEFASYFPRDIYCDQLYYSLTSSLSEFLRSPVIF